MVRIVFIGKIHFKLMMMKYKILNSTFEKKNCTLNAMKTIETFFALSKCVIYNLQIQSLNY